MEYTVAVSKDPKSKWYIGQCVEVAGALSQGRSLEELMENMKDIEKNNKRQIEDGANHRPPCLLNSLITHNNLL